MTDTIQNIRGRAVPMLGLGTYKLTGQACREGVAHALTMGYRHIDTAQMYKNEADVGAGIADAPVAREDVFLTTKVWHTNLSPEDVRRSTEESLQRLDTDYVDLLLIHWPAHLDGDHDALRSTLDAFVALHEAGHVRHIGVSNFSIRLLNQTVDHLPAEAPLFAHQAEYHPFLAQEAVLRHAREHDYLFTAYSPLAQGDALRNDTLQSIGDRHGKTAAQVTLRWLLQQPQVSAIPKAGSASHRIANLGVFDFALSDDEMTAIHNLGRGERRIDPAFAPAWSTT
ncbi:MAG: aldo/keto reductase [Longimonas sp.]|uniref:aldo/keto reductase n=1 Tax=Longimonas sp. TaxID=2039626 RepID=UPI003345B573